MKKLISVLLILTMICGMLPVAAFAAEEQTTISLWTYPVGGWGDQETAEALAGLFEEANPGIKVEVTVLDYGTGDDKINAAIEAGAAPDIILEGPERLVANWGAKGLMVDLSDLLDTEDKAEIYPAALNAGYGADGGLYLYPLTGTVHTMAINKTVFEAAGAMKYINEDSRTWKSSEAFLNAINQVYAYTGQRVGAVYCAGQGGDQGTRALVTNLGGGTYTNAAHTAYTWDSAANVKALQMLVDCDGIEFDADIVGGNEIALFYNGMLNVAFCWNIAQQRNPNMAGTGAGLTADGDEIMFLAFPSDTQPALQGGIWGFGVFNNGDAARTEAAKTFVKYMCDSKATADAVEASGFFAVRDILGDTELPPVRSDDQLMQEYSQMMRYMDDYYQITPNWTQARTCWWNLLQAVGSGENVAQAASYWNALANGKDPNASEEEKTEISLWTYPVGSWGDAQTVADLISRFEADNPGIKVKVEFLDYVTGDDKVNTAIEGGTVPDLILEGPERVVAAWGQHMVDLSDLLDSGDKAELYEGALSGCYGADGKLYQYPMAGIVHTMAINKTVFEAAGAMQYINEDARTWKSTEDFFKAVQAVSEAENGPVGTVYCGGRGGDQGTRALVNNLYGGTYTNAEHTAYTWDTAANKQALQALVDCEGITFSPDLVGGQEIAMLKNGELYMAFCWNPQAGGTTTAAGDEIMILAFPSDSTPQLCSGVWGFGVFDSGNAERIDAAKTFVKYMCDSDATEEAVMATSFLPVRSNVSGIWEDDEISSAFNDLMPCMGDYYVVTPNWGEARNAWISMLQEIAAGNDIDKTVKYWNAIANGGVVSEPGDTDGDGIVDSNDVARLLWYTLFEDSVEINGDADFNHDGVVDDKDVAYLLWHTLFPEDFPLS